ncbi:MAG: tRNA 2-thiouridine(34) synthase MnmA [Thermoanaerobacteraceae bacterium]|nr:tRNA 2-thiouridine(34) synthase MnmA [Thermoanaerobacteraceae bacterium]
MAVALSGGVDSTAAAVILQEEGYRVFAVTMRVTDDPVVSAAEVAGALGIEHHVFDLREEFRAAVVEPFIAAYCAGRTPNPCVVCNPRIKFGALMRRARELGARWFATGHYARVWRDAVTGRCLLARGCDRKKDQGYVLYHLAQEQLRHLLFPLGTKTKAEAREIVRRRGLRVTERESQEICFIPEGDYRRFLRQAVGEARPGPLVDVEGKVIGRHRGLAYYTVGQRRGLGVAAGRPLYVLALDPARNAVVVGPEDLLYRDQCIVGETNFIPFDRLEKSLAVTVKIRYTAPDKPAVISPAGEGRVAVRFAAPERAVTPGQAAVFYQGELVVGGGTILE